jgi:hypothetical protein
MKVSHCEVDRIWYQISESSFKHYSFALSLSLTFSLAGPHIPCRAHEFGTTRLSLGLTNMLYKKCPKVFFRWLFPSSELWRAERESAGPKSLLKKTFKQVASEISPNPRATCTRPSVKAEVSKKQRCPNLRVKSRIAKCYSSKQYLCDL